jgi:DNA-binding NarL/FixJ family response regulator
VQKEIHPDFQEINKKTHVECPPRGNLMMRMSSSENILNRTANMVDIHLYTISNDRYFSAGLRSLFKCREELAHLDICMTELPFEKEIFESGTLRELENKSCDVLILDCSCGFIHYYNACSTLYSALALGTLDTKVILFYENNLCLTNPDMYNHFVTLDKNSSVENIVLSIIRLSSRQEPHTAEIADGKEPISIQQYLTGRELIIINEIYNGSSPNEIASKLKLRLKTINSYKNKAMKKISTKRAFDVHP